MSKEKLNRATTRLKQMGAVLSGHYAHGFSFTYGGRSYWLNCGKCCYVLERVTERNRHGDDKEYLARTDSSIDMEKRLQ